MVRSCTCCGAWLDVSWPSPSLSLLFHYLSTHSLKVEQFSSPHRDPLLVNISIGPWPSDHCVAPWRPPHWALFNWALRPQLESLSITAISASAPPLTVFTSRRESIHFAPAYTPLFPTDLSRKVLPHRRNVISVYPKLLASRSVAERDTLLATLKTQVSEWSRKTCYCHCSHYSTGEGGK